MDGGSAADGPSIFDFLDVGDDPDRIDIGVRLAEVALARYRSPREWWQVATRPAGPDGEPVGFVFPARNSYGAIIAYIGVLPAHRGHGYIHDILAEGTRILAAQDVPRSRATTDVGNTPMAAGFTRGGCYETWARSSTLALRLLGGTVK